MDQYQTVFQCILLALMLYGLGLSLANDGKPRNKFYRPWASFLQAGVLLALLWLGGLFTPGHGLTPIVSLLGLETVSLAVVVAKGGERMPNYSFGYHCVAAALVIGLLWWAGYFQLGFLVAGHL